MGIVTSRWQVVLTGKWGGLRTVTVEARTAAEARRQVRISRAFIHETVGQACRIGSTPRQKETD